MLSPTTKSLLRFATTLMYFTGGGPFKWIPKANRIHIVQSKIHHAFCIFTFMSITIYEVFLIYRLVNATMSKASLNTKVQIGYNIVSYLVPFVLQIQCFLSWKNSPSFFNAYMAFFERFKETFSCLLGKAGESINIAKFLLPHSKYKKNGCEKLFKVFILLGSVITIQNTLVISRKPDRIYFITSLLENSKSASLIKKVPLIFLQVWVWMSLFGQLFFWAFHVFTYSYIGTTILHELRARKKEAVTKNSLRRPETFAKEYRNLQILQVIFNDSFRSWLFPSHKLVCFGISTCGTYGAIRMSGPRAIQMGVAAFLSLMYLSYMFKRLGKYYEYSIDILNTWKGGRDWVRKFVKSCSLLRIDVGSCYFIKKTTVIAIWRAVIDLTISILVA